MRRKLQEMGARNVLVSMAGEGAVLVAEDGSVYEAPAPKGKLDQWQWVPGIPWWQDLSQDGWKRRITDMHFCMGVSRRKCKCIFRDVWQQKKRYETVYKQVIGE